MSILIMSKVWWLKEFNITKKMVLLALADNANDEGYCWPGVGYLSTKCSTSKITVRSKIKELKEEGYLEIIPRTDKKGMDISNGCQINVRKIEDEYYKTQGVRRLPPGGKEVTPLTTILTKTTPLGNGDVLKEKDTPTSSHATAADFETFWKAWPARVPEGGGRPVKNKKGDAEVKWRKLCNAYIKTDRPPPITTWLLVIERMKEKAKPCHYPDAITFLNNLRWKNFVSPEEITPSLPPSMGKIVSRLALRLQTVLGNIPYHKEFEPHPFTPDHAEYTGMNATVRAVITEWDGSRYPTCDNGKQLVKRYTDWLKARDVLPSARGLLPRDGATWKQFVKQLGDA